MYKIRLKCFGRWTTEAAYKNKLENSGIKFWKTQSLPVLETPCQLKWSQCLGSSKRIARQVGQCSCPGLCTPQQPSHRPPANKENHIVTNSIRPVGIYASAWYQIHNIMMVSTSANFDAWWLL